MWSSLRLCILSSLILSYFPTGHLSFCLPSSVASALLPPTLHTSSVATATEDICLMPLPQSQRKEKKTGNASKGRHSYLHGDSCVQVSLCYMQRKKMRTLQVHLHKRSTRMHLQRRHEEERGCVVRRCHRIILTAADKQI